MRLAITLIVLFSMGLIGTVALAAGTGTDLRYYQDVINALQGQVELLRWIGGAMVGGLAVAVVQLFRALMASQKETAVIADRSAKADEKLALSIDNLKNELNQRPCLKE